MKQFFGKYRGKVSNNEDPLRLGRVEVVVPAVLGNVPRWALPCVPYAGPDRGLVALPNTEANVWVEFEAGDPDYPIWAGCFWGEGELPAAVRSGTDVWKTDAGALILSKENGLRLEVAQTGLSISLSASGGIRIENGAGATIELTQNMVRLNDEAREIS